MQFLINHRFLAALGLGLITCLLSGEAFARTWKSKVGGYSVEAELVEATATEVKLKKTNGNIITVAIDRLSDEDVTFVKTLKLPANVGAKVEPIKFKILDDEFTINAPIGAKVEVEGVFPTIRHGKTFLMSIQPTGDSDLADFKEQFTKQPDVIGVQKVLLEEVDALAYKVLMKAFKKEVSVYMVVVELDGKKYTCSDTSFEEMNRPEKLAPKDIDLMVQCAKSLNKVE